MRKNSEKKLRMIVVVLVAFIASMSFNNKEGLCYEYKNSGAKLRFAQKAEQEVDITIYHLFFGGSKVLQWTSEEAAPNFTGMPEGRYGISATQVQLDTTGRERYLFNGYIYFPVPVEEPPVLILEVDTYKEVSIILTNVPDDAQLEDNQEVRINLTDGGWNSGYGTGFYNASTNTISGSVTGDLFGDYNMVIVSNSSSESVFHSLVSDTNLANAFWEETNTEITYADPAGDSIQFEEEYAHNYWLREGIEDEISIPGEILSYKFKAQQGEILRIKTWGDTDNKLCDSRLQIVNSSGEQQFTGWLDDICDYEECNFYEDIRFAVGRTDTYTVFVGGFGEMTGEFNLRIVKEDEY